ncbi:MAG: DUF305 domain-containing protein [Pseudonocardiaceae bacterium]
MRRVFAVAGLGVAALLIATGCGSAATDSPPNTGTRPPATSAASAHNAADVAFAQQMIPHHRQAISMAELASSRAASPKVRDLASQIKKDQSSEIATMTNWLQTWHAAPAGNDPGEGSAMGGMNRAAMAGMMSNQQMSQLANTSGPAFDRLFLQRMIAHHEGAVQMATTERATGQNTDAQNLATAIQRSQTAQIATMRQLLAGH